MKCAWFAPQHMLWAEVFTEMEQSLGLLVESASKGAATIRFVGGGRLDFWSLENPIAGRSRGYDRVVIDEAAFAKNGDLMTDGSMHAIWARAIRPTLYDRAGEALLCSNSAGKNPDNFFYNACTDASLGFREFYATTLDNPLLPKPLRGETKVEWAARRAAYLAELKAANHPLVYAQEYEAAFVDWSGVAFFARDKLLEANKPVPLPTSTRGVFAIIDTATKTGTDHDGTAVTYFSFDDLDRRWPLQILDWDIVQIEGATLEAWLPSVFRRLEELARECRARVGSIGAWIEDQNAGTILLQQAIRRGMRASRIDSKLTSLGKDERAMSVSSYVHRGLVKYTEPAFNKTVVYKGHSRNHLLDQVESFRIGDKKSDREDDLLDTFCYGIALALGNSDGF